MGHGGRGGGTPQPPGAGRGPWSTQREAAADTDFSLKLLVASGTVKESISVASSHQGWGRLLQWQQEAKRDARISVTSTRAG